MKLFTVTVEGNTELDFQAEDIDEAREIIRQTLPQTNVDYDTLKEKEVGTA